MWPGPSPKVGYISVIFRPIYRPQPTPTLTESPDLQSLRTTPDLSSTRAPPPPPPPPRPSNHHQDNNFSVTWFFHQRPLISYHHLPPSPPNHFLLMIAALKDLDLKVAHHWVVNLILLYSCTRFTVWPRNQRIQQNPLTSDHPSRNPWNLMILGSKPLESKGIRDPCFTTHPHLWSSAFLKVQLNMHRGLPHWCSLWYECRLRLLIITQDLEEATSITAPSLGGNTWLWAAWLLGKQS